MKKQLFESILQETSGRFLVIDGGLDEGNPFDDCYYFYLADDGSLKEFNDGELPRDARINPTTQEIYNAIKEMFTDYEIVDGQKAIMDCTRKVYATDEGYITLYIYDDDCDEYIEVDKDVKLLSVKDPEV